MTEKTQWERDRDYFHSLMDTPFNYPQKLKIRQLDVFIPKLIATGDMNDKKIESISKVLMEACQTYNDGMCQNDCDVDPNGWDGCYTRKILSIISDIERSCETCLHKEKTDQEKPCCYCGGGNPEWTPTVSSDSLRSNDNPEDSVIN